MVNSNDQKSFPDDNTTMIGDIPTKVLSIEQKDDFTEYTCTASNIAGIDNKTVNVRTLSKPTCMHAHAQV